MASSASEPHAGETNPALLPDGADPSVTPDDIQPPGEHEATEPSSGHKIRDEEDGEPDEEEELGNIEAAHNGSQIVRKAKTKNQREASRGKKAGNQGRFHGEELEYLEGKTNEYALIPKGKSSPNPALDAFWAEVIAGYWDRFT